MDKKLIYTGQDLYHNWFYNRYYYAGSNSRYYTFQIALNILNQRFVNPVIIETGCQRQKEDVGAGMSTSIFAEYISRYGGSLISIDINQQNLDMAAHCVSKWPNSKTTFVCNDSVNYLKNYTGPCDLLYLDSYDYPIFELLKLYRSDLNFDEAQKELAQYSREDIVKKHHDLISDCQIHCLKEFQAIENKLQENVILLIDDNQLYGGGKPRLLKDYLSKGTDGWICLLDLQSSLWVKKI